MIMSFPLKNYIVLFILGATIGAGGDLFHNLTGTSFYTQPDFLGLSWWVFPLFGVAVCVLAALQIKIDEVLNEPMSNLKFSEVVGGLLFFEFVYYLSGVLRPIGNVHIFIVLSFLAVFFWFVFDRTVLGFVLGVMVAVGGCFVESSLSRLDLFHYQNADLFGVPSWLGFVYFVASIAVGHLARYLRDCQRPLEREV